MSTPVPTAADANAVIDRMKEALKVDSDAALAQMLGTTRSRISKWRARGSVPYADAVFLALRFDLSLDFLLTGRSDSRASKELIDEALLSEILSARMSRLRAKTISPSQWARAAKEIADTYERAQTMIARFMDTAGLDAAGARAAALAALQSIEAAKKQQGPN